MNRLLLTLLAAVLFVAPVAAQGLFDAPWIGYNTGDYTTGRNPVALLVEDFTDDGYPDAVVARSTWNSGFAFLRNAGDGTYLAPTHHASAGPTTWGAVSGDFDGDGDLDVVTTNSDSYHSTGNTVSFFRNDGAGTFAAPVNATTGTGPNGVTAADFNRDGHLDLATANFGYIGFGTTVSVLMGTGTGTFAAPVTYTVEDGPHAIEAGDLDGDGDADLAVGHEDYRVSILKNNGSGTFGTPTLYTLNYNWASPFFAALTLVDYDKDSDLDVLYSNTRTYDGTTGHVAFLKNNGSGVLSTAPSVTMLAYSAGPTNLDTADLNGDGWADLLAAHSEGRANDGIMVSMSNGAGGFLPAVGYWGGQTTADVAASDVDKDGDQDLLSIDSYSLELTVHRNPGNGVFPQAAYSTAAAASLYVDLGDVDHDGDPDAFTSGGGASGSNPAVMLNNGTGSFGAPTTYGAGSYGKLRDLNGDGDLDLLYASNPVSPPYDFFVAFGNGNGTFGTVTRWTLNACGTGPLDALDLDHDSDLDVVMSEYGGCAGVPDSYRRVWVRKNRGDGTFDPAYTLATDQYGPFALAGADLDKDGHVDLAVAHKGAYGASNTVVVLFGNGAGQVREKRTYTIGYGPHGIVAADLNGDTWLDLATGNTGYNNEGQETTSVLLNVGGVGFGVASTYYAPYSSDLLGVTGIAVGDPDGDGDQDLMVSNYASKDVAFYENSGAGTFTFAHRYGVGAYLFDTHYADVTGDDVPDLVGLIGLRPAGGTSALAVVPGLGDALPPPVPTLDIEVTLVSGAPVPASGGTVRYEVAVTNTTAASQTTQYWVETTQPTGAVRAQAPVTVTVAAGATYRRTLSQRLNSRNRAGVYTVTVKVGTHPSTVVDSDAFTFEKLATAAATANAEGSGLPTEYALEAPSPNPFRDRTALRFALPEAVPVTLAVYDALGRRVALLLDGAEQEAGYHAVRFDAAGLPSGTYVARLEAGAYAETRRLAVIR